MTFISSRSLVALVAAGCIALVALLLVGQDFTAAVAKLIASTAFVALAICVGALQTTYGRIILLGLVCSWFGDALLIGETQYAFLAGLGAFLLAHVAYVAAFVTKGVDRLWIGSAAVPIGIVALVVTMWLAPHVPSELVIPVRVYTAAISLMVIAAFGTRGRGASILILAGALMFFLSDLSVAALRLVQTDFPTYVWGLPLYYAGQVCLAISASQSRSH
jgi:uncharacterized membrane protein YhhN